MFDAQNVPEEDLQTKMFKQSLFYQTIISVSLSTLTAPSLGHCCHLVLISCRRARVCRDAASKKSDEHKAVMLFCSKTTRGDSQSWQTSDINCLVIWTETRRMWKQLRALTDIQEVDKIIETSYNTTAHKATNYHCTSTIWTDTKHSQTYLL